jgi:hypothetical protein
MRFMDRRVVSWPGRCQAYLTWTGAIGTTVYASPTKKP